MPQRPRRLRLRSSRLSGQNTRLEAGRDPGNAENRIRDGLPVNRAELGQRHLLGLDFVYGFIDPSSRHGISGAFAACSTSTIRC
jgi:hypothetical protein